MSVSSGVTFIKSQITAVSTNNTPSAYYILKQALCENKSILWVCVVAIIDAPSYMV